MEVVIVLIVVICVTGWHLWPKIVWKKKDWEHPKLSDSYDPMQSRGRIRGRNNEGV